MVLITFPDPETRKQALVYLLGRFSGTLLKSGEVIVPENALKPLALQDLVFTVKGQANEEQVASLRTAAAKTVQQRKRRAKGMAGVVPLDLDQSYEQACQDLWVP